MSYQCSICGEEHGDLPDYGFTWPDYYFGVPESERKARIRGTTDTCEIDEHCFIRGVLLLPLLDTDGEFGIGVWVSQHPKNFQIYIDNFESPDIGPFFVWLSNRIPSYEIDTLQMKTRAVFQADGQRPIIELDECDHPLYVDWKNGIKVERVLEWIHNLGDAA